MRRGEIERDPGGAGGSDRRIAALRERYGRALAARVPEKRLILIPKAEVQRYLDAGETAVQP